MIKLVLTCEHGGNNIPKEYQKIFRDSAKLLSTHRGYDIGALELFNNLISQADYYSFSETSRLLIELNRSLKNKNLFSAVTKPLDSFIKDEIKKNYYFPYRDKVESQIAYFIKQKHTVIHISVHTFTPVFNNVTRNCDIGFLYDPSHSLEKQFCKSIKKNIIQNNPSLNVRYNFPYLGTADGFTSYLRKIFPKENYLGIEIEVNQKFPSKKNKEWNKIVHIIYDSLTRTLADF